MNRRGSRPACPACLGQDANLGQWCYFNISKTSLPLASKSSDTRACMRLKKYSAHRAAVTMSTAYTIRSVLRRVALPAES